MLKKDYIFTEIETITWRLRVIHGEKPVFQNQYWDYKR